MRINARTAVEGLIAQRIGCLTIARDLAQRVSGQIRDKRLLVFWKFQVRFSHNDQVSGVMKDTEHLHLTPPENPEIQSEFTGGHRLHSLL